MDVVRRLVSCRLAASLLLPALSWGRPHSAPHSPRVFKVGILWNSTPQTQLDQGTVQGGGPRIIEEALRKLGWSPGRNVQLISRTAESRYERMPQLVEELLGHQVDVLVVFGPEAANAARARTSEVPIVWAGSYTLGATARPHDNVTGFTFSGGPSALKRLEILKALAPKASRIAMFAQVMEGQERPTLTPVFLERAHRLGLDPFVVYLGSRESFASAFERAVAAGADCAYMSVFPELTWSEAVQGEIIQLSRKYRLPTIYEMPSLARSGALIGYGSDAFEGHRRAAFFIDRILRGAKPFELPVEQVTKVELNVNRRAAKELGLEIPALIAIRADNVFD